MPKCILPLINEDFLNYSIIIIIFQLQKCKGLLDKVKAVAFTDSVHSLPHQGGDKTLLKWMKKVRFLGLTVHKEVL